MAHLTHIQFLTHTTTAPQPALKLQSGHAHTERSVGFLLENSNSIETSVSTITETKTTIPEIAAHVVRKAEKRRNEQDSKDGAMTLPRDQVHGNPICAFQATSVDTSGEYNNKITWSVSVGGVSYLIEDIFSTKLESAIHQAHEYSCLLTGH